MKFSYAIRAAVLAGAIYAVFAAAQTKVALPQLAGSPPSQGIMVLCLPAAGAIAWCPMTGASVSTSGSVTTISIPSAQQPTSMQAVAMTRQTDGSYLAPAYPVSGQPSGFLVIRNGVVQQQTADYLIDTANPMHVLPAGTWNASDTVLAFEWYPF